MKLIPLLLIALLLCGCAALTQAKADYAACYADPVCHANMLAKAKMAGEIGQVSGASSGIPLAGQVAGSVFSAIALLVAGVAGGAALRKKETKIVVAKTLADQINEANK